MPSSHAVGSGGPSLPCSATWRTAHSRSNEKLGAIEAAVSTQPFNAPVEPTEAERPVFRRAVAAYLEAQKPHVGRFEGPTADEILEELTPTPVRWVQLAALVIEVADIIPASGTHENPGG